MLTPYSVSETGSTQPRALGKKLALAASDFLKGSFLQILQALNPTAMIFS